MDMPEASGPECPRPRAPPQRGWVHRLFRIGQAREEEIVTRGHRVPVAFPLQRGQQRDGLIAEIHNPEPTSGSSGCKTST
jgi:hypothetical protein